MEKPKKSPIQISEFSLTTLEFKRVGSRPRRLKIPANFIKIEAVVEELDALAYSIVCHICINEEAKEALDFSAKIEYQMVAKTIDPEFKKQLEGFAKVGAPFNALVHARELIASLTARAFGRTAMLPLIDIRDFESTIHVTSVEKESATPETETAQEPNSPTKSQ